jgi:hypothetical protein
MLSLLESTFSTWSDDISLPYVFLVWLMLASFVLSYCIDLNQIT